MNKIFIGILIGITIPIALKHIRIIFNQSVETSLQARKRQREINILLQERREKINKDNGRVAIGIDAKAENGKVAIGDNVRTDGTGAPALNIKDTIFIGNELFGKKIGVKDLIESYSKDGSNIIPIGKPAGKSKDNKK